MNHVVKPGDCLASIAAEYGFFWQTIWNLPENNALKVSRKNPYVLLPGDQVFIPELGKKEEACTTGKRHRFRVTGVPERLVIALTDERDQPIADRPYVIEIDQKLTFQGQTDAEGTIRHHIPPRAREGHLRVGSGSDIREYDLNLGGVDPVEVLSGVQGRLFNLGFYDGPIDGQPNPQTTTALLLFQDRYQLSPSGENDSPTQSKLKELFGC